MKFEQVLKMYWSKGLFFNGKVFSFQHTLKSFCNEAYGVNHPSMRQLVYRFELNRLLRKQYLPLGDTNSHNLTIFNIIFSQWSSINHLILDLKRLTNLRLFLLKTSRGKSQALGKPSRGQRTWSNAWTAYFLNKTVRIFVSKMQAEMRKNQKDEQINFKILKKKSKKVKNTGVVKTKKKKRLVWF